MNKAVVIKAITQELQNGNEYGMEIDGYNIKQIDSFVGIGDRRHKIFAVTCDQTFETMNVKADGYYNSFEGTLWYDAEVYECASVEKTVKVWEKV